MSTVHVDCGTDECCNTCEPHTPSANEVETFTGKFVDTGNPNLDDIVLEDIAHALSSICRFGGHSTRFYSVAEHSVFVSKRLEERGYGLEICLAGLHHDSSEAYLGDIPRPLKLLLAAAYKPLSDRMDKAIANALARKYRPWIYPTDFHRWMVKDADNYALLIEANHLMPSHGLNWEGSSMDKTDPPDTPDYWTGGLNPADAEGLFLSRHWELVTGVIDKWELT